ncbi:MAG: transcriptional repressor LexA [Bacillota bacterium]|nr:transcriptional repressor LexA [Bacillota bacterium]
MGKNNRQQLILDFIQKYTNENGYPPTIREICDGVGLKSPSTVHGHLERMKRDGLLKKDDSKTRAIKVSETKNSFPETEYLEVPVIGTVAAGVPITAQEDIERVFPLPMDFAKKGEVFMLKVKGDSMINVGIFSGDYVIVEQTPAAVNGQIVVALIEDEATVKTFYKESGYFRLQPENDFMEPIIVSDVAILGKVVGVYRKL